jgi:hypothetical protein
MARRETQGEREQRMRLLDDHIGQALRESAASGELASAPSYGRPQHFGDGHAETPAELRVPMKVLKDAGVLQPEGWPACALAWLLARSAWGQGCAFEAVGAARQPVQTVRRLTPLASYILPGNLASARLAQRLGATLQGEVDIMGLKATRWVHP